MNHTDASHKAGPTVPPQLKTGEYVRLDGPHAGVCTGLYKLIFYKNGASFATLPIQRASKDSFGFEVHGSFEGHIEVKGHYHDCATGEEHQHSFGFTDVTRG